MKKLLSMIGSLSLLTTSTISVVSCGGPINPRPEEKLEFNEENVEKFFTENKTFSYEGEFIFIDEPRDEEIKSKLPTMDFLNSLMRETIIKEMEKTLELETDCFYDVGLEINRADINNKFKNEKYLVSGKKYVFKYDKISIKNTKTDVRYVFEDFEFVFEQTNSIKQNNISEKNYEFFLNYWLGGVNSPKNHKFHWVNGGFGEFYEVSILLAKNDLPEARNEIEKGINENSNPIFMSSSRTPIYEEYRFDSKVNDIKLLQYETEELYFVEVSGEAQFKNTNKTKADFSATWGFYKHEEW
ncbi:hypothetical protein SSABA_v1c01580 [Spiroplasma sabaudiense Ar-1343]|uniref:Lipoprotein n=1 Tax=Spiroplasma sabaudiense Ar-1343 TaxID=1276257 RepID=W6A9K7_9MOLU|nr:lipoprotein [Spiroplasma sabaudiense]AHI53570.1 hypothetical protein SSABA_v1c01580 [Spiroplasma sabaudiense Ar-1343]